MSHGVGHNGGPPIDPLVAELHKAAKEREEGRIADLLRAIGPKRAIEIKPFKLGAPWTHHADGKDLKRLAKLQAQITRAEMRLSDLKAERSGIMNKCIRRMRRLAGKN